MVVGVGPGLRAGSARERDFEMGQVVKGTRWMPWHQEAMKDAGACDEPRRAGKRATTRGFPNGETRSGSYRITIERTRGTEPSKYPAEKKSNETPLVVASERGSAQTLPVQAGRRCWKGVVGPCGHFCRSGAESTIAVVAEAPGKVRRRG